MDTPERSLHRRYQQQQQPLQQQKIVTPVSRSGFEDSPVFNYINNLSPIKPVKSVHNTQTFQSLNFTSIPSIFTSPHVNKQTEDKFLIRRQLLDLSKPEVSCNNGMGLSCVVKLSEYVANEENDGSIRCSLNEANMDPPDECPPMTNNVSHSEQYDCGSPDHNTTPSYDIKTHVILAKDSASLIDRVQDGSEERNNQLHSCSEFQSTHKKFSMDKVPSCNWENLISNDTEDLLVFDSSTESEESKGHVQTLDHDSNLLSLSSSNSVNIVDYSQKSHIKSLSAVPEENIDEGTSDNIPLESKMKRGMRRRCLVFGMAGTHGKNTHSDPKNNLLTSLSCHENFSTDNGHSASTRSTITKSQCVLPSIGLHLNSISSNSKDLTVTKENLLSPKQISMPHSSCGQPSHSSEQKSLYTSLSHGKGHVSADSRANNCQVMHVSADNKDNNCHGMVGVSLPAIEKMEELNQTSPKKKKRRTDSSTENESRKRCTCKKSKCLKLYCECFAAGIYCVEPCACQGCLNKPVHEDTVLATRKQIESRNPLAFAPKVIKTSEKVAEIGEETNRTPASARHKRGCNCKKSGCLKKYCECYQGGAGCSVSCRCEGCKNTFGTKDGKMAIGIEETECDEETGTCKSEGENPNSQQNANVGNNGQPYLEAVLPITPSFQIFRQHFKQPFSSSRKPPLSSVLAAGSSPRLNACKTLGKSEMPSLHSKFEKPLQVDSEEETPEILRGNASPVSGLKVASPSRKRVSPPHNESGISPSHKGCRKLILRSIPSFPSLSSDSTNEFPTNIASSPLNLSKLS